MPIIKVERCNGGGKSGYFRLTNKQGQRESVSNPHGDKWDRSFAAQAKDVFQNLYGYKRSNIKFHHAN